MAGQRVSGGNRRIRGSSLVTSLRQSNADIRMRGAVLGETAKGATAILIACCDAIGAEWPLDITGAHVDGCHYHGDARLDLIERLVAGTNDVAFRWRSDALPHQAQRFDHCRSNR